MYTSLSDDLLYKLESQIKKAESEIESKKNVKKISRCAVILQ
jgi:hypothetical protein